MKILYINHEKNLGGAAKSLIGIMNEMINKGYDVYVLTPFKSGGFISICKENKKIKVISKRYFSCIRKDDVTLNKYVDNIVIYLLAYVYNYLIAYRIAKIVKDLKIDIIHTNTCIINIGNYLSKITHIPQIVHFREFVEEDFSWKFIPNKNKVLSNIKKYSYYQVFISKILKRKYSEYFDSDRQYCIYNGITMKKQINKKSDHEYLNMIIVGRLIEGKGQLEAIEALNILVNNEGLNKIRLYIVGACEGNYVNRLKKKIDEYSLNDQVVFTGYISNVNELRGKMDYELVCSKSEGFGRVVIEGMLCDNVMIVSNAGALPEIVNNGINGFVYESGNFKQLARLILNCYKGNYDLKLIKQNAKKTCNEKFTQKKNANEIEKLYLKLLNNKYEDKN